VEDTGKAALITRREISLILLISVLLTACSQPGISTAPSPSPAAGTPSPDSTPGIPAYTPTSSSLLIPNTPDLPTVESTTTLDQPTLETSPDILPDTSPDLPRTQYHLSAQFDYNRHHLAVTETVTYTNLTGEVIVDLVFVVEPNRYPGAFQLMSLDWEDGSPVESYSLAGNRLTIQLPAPLLPAGSLRLSMAYELDLPIIPPPSDTSRPVPFGYTARQTNVVDWYPYLPPYLLGRGWLVHDPWFYGEHQVYELADYQVDLQPTASPPGLVIAASSPATRTGAGYHYDFEAGRSFAWSVSPDYHVFSQTVGTVTVLSYAFPFTLPAGDAVLNEAARAVELYSGLFSPYRHSSLSVVEADFLDGMEYDGLFFLSRGFYNLYDGTPKGYLTFIDVHETAHQWWYGLVGNDQALEPWLDEALCTYTERLFYERHYPDLVDWWWYYRVDYYEPAGWVNNPIYEFTGFRPYVNAVYLRGAKFLEDLRDLIGDDTFFAFLRDYATRETDKLATADDFFRILSEHTSKDLQPLLSTYFKP
jgi:hypothetical protein